MKVLYLQVSGMLAESKARKTDEIIGGCDERNWRCQGWGFFSSEADRRNAGRVERLEGCGGLEDDQRLSLMMPMNEVIKVTMIFISVQAYGDTWQGRVTAGRVKRPCDLVDNSVVLPSGNRIFVIV